MCISCIASIGSWRRDVIKAVLFTIFFGKLLPFADVWSDVRLGIHLFVNGHKKWAFSVLAPVIVNTFFTLVLCREMEKKKSRKCWIIYIPMVIFQVYPQWCLFRILLEFGRHKINLKQFITKRDSFDGGIGCLEPYLESVPQVYIQTALFAFVHNIDSIITRLCYTARDPMCTSLDICDPLFNCDMDPYATGYQKYTRVMNLTKNEHIQTLAFENCTQHLKRCIDKCYKNVSDILLALDETELYKYIETPDLWYNHSLVKDYDATLADLKVIQMHRLVIGNRELFMLTYLISIIAAAYGVSKFFRLGYSRVAHKIFSVKFMFISIVGTAFLVLKGLVLGSIIDKHNQYSQENETNNILLESMAFWLLFTKLPTMLMVLTFTIAMPCYKIYKKLGKFRIKAVTDIILKQPSLILAPHITPFFFELSDIEIIDTLAVQSSHRITISPGSPLIQKKKTKYLSCIGNYAFSPRLTAVNVIISIIFTLSLLFWKSNWITNGWERFFSIFVAICIWVVGLIGYKMIGGLTGNAKCLEHFRNKCLECTKTYGFFVNKYKSITACDSHEKHTPFEYKTDIEACQVCSEIKMRYAQYLYLRLPLSATIA